MKRNNLNGLLLLVCLLVSCSSTKIATSRFSELQNSTLLNGVYQNIPLNIYTVDSLALPNYKPELYCLLGLLNLTTECDSGSIIRLEFEKKQLIVSYPSITTIQEMRIKGEQKKNYFEIYLRRRLIPIPFIYFVQQIERVRIGVNKDSNLTIQYWEKNFGWVPIMASGTTYDYEFVFERVEE